MSDFFVFCRMFSLEKLNRLTAKNVLERVNDVAIYSRYFSINSKKRVISSPFREDKNPSFSFFFHGKDGVLLWKDFSTGECGNVFSFLKKLFNLDFNKVLEMINTDFELGLKESVYVEREQFIPKEVYRERESTTITFTPREFNQRDLEIIASWGIKEEAINFEAVDRYRINKKHTYECTDIEKPTYAYEIENRVKLYSPFSSTRKWLSTLAGTDVMLGKNMPITKDTLILTKSFKDCAVLNSMGFYAMSFQSESILPKISDYDGGIREHPISVALEDSGLHKIGILYDNDSAGHKGALMVRDFLLAHSQALPKMHDCGIITHQMNKDITDSVEAYGTYESEQYLDELLKETFRTIWK